MSQPALLLGITAAAFLLQLCCPGESSLMLLKTMKTAWHYDTYHTTIDWRWYSYPADSAIDGSPHTCQCTTIKQNAWWAVDLQGVCKVFGLLIKTNDYQNFQSLANFDVVVSNTKPPRHGPLPNLAELTTADLCVTHPGVMPRGWTNLWCTTPKIGRYLYVILKGTNYLSMCEVKVLIVSTTTTTHPTVTTTLTKSTASTATTATTTSTVATTIPPATTTSTVATTSPTATTTSTATTITSTSATTTTATTTSTASRTSVAESHGPVKSMVLTPALTTATASDISTSSVTPSETCPPDDPTSSPDTTTAPPATNTTTASPTPDTTSTPPAKTSTSTSTSTTSPTVTAPEVYKQRAHIQERYAHTPTPCRSDGWAYSQQSGMCYMFFTEEVSQAEAIDVCRGKDNSDLLSIQNQDEQDFIDTALKNDFRDQWTYGKLEVQNGTKTFTYGGKSIEYYNWLPDDMLSEPGDQDDVCICLVKNRFLKGFVLLVWKWDRRPCAEKRSFICQHEAKRCPALPTAQFVEAHPPKNFIGLTIHFTCAPGYEMPNYTLRYKEWLAKKPPPKSNSSLSEWWARKPNVTEMPLMRYSCNAYGYWSDGSLAPCEPKSCKEPPEVKHAVRNSSDRIYPTWIEYECEHGYHYAYDNTSAKVGWCSPDAEWIDVPKDCEPVECEPFPRVGNATLNSANNRYLDNVVWTCITGFMFPDTAISKWISCRENYVNFQIGRWNISKLDDCIPLRCPEPPVPVNTTIESWSGRPNDTTFGTVLQYSCVSDEFEFPDGDDSIRSECGASAHWVPIVPPCSKKPEKLKLKGKFYVPPPKESPSAKTVGSLAMIIMIILMIIVLLMDLGTIYRGFRFARFNLRSRFFPNKKKMRPKTD